MIPLYPEGTTLASIIRITMQVQKRELNLRISKRIFHGWGVREIAEQCLSPLQDPGNAIKQHSAAPILLALRYDTYATGLEDALLQGMRPKISAHELLPVSSAVRRCPLCVANDIKQVGAACARVLHQVIGVAHCPIHKVPLQQACGACGKEFEELLVTERNKIARTIGDLLHCGACGCSTGLDLPQPRGNAYLYYVALLTEALAGRAWMLKPTKRKHLVDSVAKLAVEENIDIALAFTKEWGVASFEEVAASYGTRTAHLESALSGKNFGHYTVASLMAVAFALSFLASRKIDYAGQFCELEDATKGIGTENETFDERFMRVGKKNAIPTAILEMLARGSCWDRYSKTFNVIAALRHSLSDEDNQQLEQREAAYQATKSARLSSFGRQRTLNRYEVRRLVRSVLHGKDPSKTRPHVLDSRRDLCRWMRLHDYDWLNETTPGIYELFLDESHSVNTTRENLLSRSRDL
ncbi:hypothetical protein [Variovorax sp. HJSM1_2]|uniref:hypothetical protein n=1 Tax=Variovorax sp. HJSM1_2 TaxID=3366263 RepID=UPI003BE84D97